MHTYIQSCFITDIIVIEPLPRAGSERKYYRVWINDKTYIACENSNIAENETFFYFTDFFAEQHIPVPQIVDISKDRTKYILQDLGTHSLLDTLLDHGETDIVKAYYTKSISDLVRMQLAGATLDFSKCYAASSFDKNAVLADLNYSKYYFLDLHNLHYNKTKLNDEFEMLAAQIASIEPVSFMFRDFQGRNIMIQNDAPYFIDYQGGMKGPLQYDIASLLWQAKANLSAAWKKDLFIHYLNELKSKIVVDEQKFTSDYSIIVLARLLQVLGAYGLRGMIEQRSHFLSSIPLGLKNIEEWNSIYTLQGYPELNRVLQKLTFEIPKEKYQYPKAAPDSNLKVTVTSFSYKKGIPSDESGNGGGFVFDCRGILNPGRFEEYKKLTGRDKPVIEFLETKTRIHQFLNHAKQIIDISVEDYLKRGFENLVINFGCTGGQHRSVYSADAMAKHLNEKYNITAFVKHVEQEAKNWVN